MPKLLHYRPWRGTLHAPAYSVWPIARVGLGMIFRRKLFWALYILALMFFLLFFFGQYLLAWAETQVDELKVPLFGRGGLPVTPSSMIRFLRDGLKLNGEAEMYRGFFGLQGGIVMIVLALAGSILVGNDFQFGSVPFFLSKPLRAWHYLLGKCLAVGVFVNMMTTVPALVLFVQYAFLYEWRYLAGPHHVTFINPLLLGILGYGAVLTLFLSLLLVATASWLRRTVPVIMVWTALFVLVRELTRVLVDGLHYSVRWRLLDLWNNSYLLGSWCLRMDVETLRPREQPSFLEAALVLGGVCLLCLTYLTKRIRAVEIVK